MHSIVGRAGAMMYVASYIVTTDDLHMLFVHLLTYKHNTVLTLQTTCSTATWVGKMAS